MKEIKKLIVGSKSVWLRVFVKEAAIMEMEFETDRQRRNAIYDCVKMLAQAKSLPIYVMATGLGVDDGIQTYHVCIVDKDVRKYLEDRRGEAEVVGLSYEKYVTVPLYYFDASRKHITDVKFSDSEKVAKVYARIGQRIYAEWKRWRDEEWPEVE